MLLIESRRASPHARRTATSCCWPTRTAAAGTASLIAEGQAIVRRCLRRNQPGPYQIQAAINAVHSDAPTAAATDWRQILQLYDQLLALAPSPVVALNRAVAVAEVEGPEAALALVDGLTSTATTCSTPSAPTCSRLGRDAEAAWRTRRRSAHRERGRARVPRTQARGLARAVSAAGATSTRTR